MKTIKSHPENISHCNDNELIMLSENNYNFYQFMQIALSVNNLLLIKRYIFHNYIFTDIQRNNFLTYFLSQTNNNN